ncbi:YacL family protein [Paraglaciecola sp. L3A3]|uniref:UPF0231 family protein n=1 Tax=Paraglaciecola sp. L3A3 TaxID=2686358 RepID=UPI00131EA5A3|nr:YacL family protein [Paraglaciecola sp. L3A3]
MDFQFQTDITGLPIAKCDIECEAFGDWLSHDLSVDQGQIDELLEKIDQLLNKKLIQYTFIGKIYHLVFESDEVELILNNSDVSSSEFSEQISDQQITGCGLIDLQNLLLEWKSFTSLKGRIL